MAKRISSEIEAPPERAERRYVYNGDTQRPEFTAPRGNRPVKRRKRSTSLIIGGLILVSLFIVLYIWNKIAVNRLAVEVNDLQSQYDKALNVNETLRAEINKKSGLERIGKTAGSQLNLVQPREQPVWFEIDSGRLGQLEKNARARGTTAQDAN
jgi:cell division protein FtsL